MITLGWVVAIGLPLAVMVGVIVWPERIPKDRTAREIRTTDPEHLISNPNSSGESCET
ncbi:hypothetical protein [Nocardia sp. CA-135398]|uniref:hypothetical protein n=1 Tax=Nocardia sp. CA-135398 TaxID=3239977 RepID=UPI003D99541E